MTTVEIINDRLKLVQQFRHTMGRVSNNPRIYKHCELMAEDLAKKLYAEFPLHWIEAVIYVNHLRNEIKK